MRRNKLLTLMSAACLICGVAQEASATSWFDFSQTKDSVLITGPDFAHTTTLRVVTATCPAAGFLLAQGSAQILLTPVPGNDSVQGGISITRNHVAPYPADPDHYSSIVFSTPNGNNAVLPGFVQRVDSCKQDQKITYRFVAWHESATDGSSALGPNLVVQFFSDRI
jgi:hypothetical protein